MRAPWGPYAPFPQFPGSPIAGGGGVKTSSAGKALGIRRRTLGEDHPKVADSYNNMANVYYSTSKYDQALEYYEDQGCLFFLKGTQPPARQWPVGAASPQSPVQQGGGRHHTPVRVLCGSGGRCPGSDVGRSTEATAALGDPPTLRPEAEWGPSTPLTPQCRWGSAAPPGLGRGGGAYCGLQAWNCPREGGMVPGNLEWGNTRKWRRWFREGVRTGPSWSSFMGI